MIEIEVTDRVDFDRLATEWRDLEARSDASFFQSWSWVGCRVRERFPRPVVVSARENGVAVALGLFNRASGRLGQPHLLLQESGDAAHDAVFVEHNGLLVERGREPGALVRKCLDHALAYPTGGLWRRPRRLVLNGVGDEYIASAAAAYRHRVRAERPAPYVDLMAVRHAGGDYLAGLSANTRYQLRRSRRRYAAEGELTIRRADSAAEALDFLDRLAEWHQRYWTGRGRPGAFANPEFTAFHRALTAAGVAAGHVDLLRIAAGERPIGYLYNFRYKGRVYAYQSGFDYATADPHCKPGMTCHHLAIETYLREGAVQYDFLAGGDRYKASLATAATPLYWLEIGRDGNLARAADRLGDRLRRWRPTLRAVAATR